VAINTNGSHLAVDRRVTLTAEAGFYADAAFTDQYGTLAEGRVLPLLGPALGTNAYAVLVDTSKPYDDGVDRPSVVYVSKSKATDPYTVEPEPGPPSDDVEAALAARDLEWREWLDAAPGEVLSTAQAVVAWGELAPDQD